MNKKYYDKVRGDRYFCIKDINCVITVEHMTRKYLLKSLDTMIEEMNNGHEYDDTFVITYSDGIVDVIDEYYDGHKIKKQHIVSIIYNNEHTISTFGNYEINDDGIVSYSEKETVGENIMEVDSADYRMEETEETEIIGGETDMDNRTIAARASIKGGKRFYKSYVKDIRLVGRRKVSPFVYEEDYTFGYKGERYRVNSEVIPDSKGSKQFSVKFDYKLQKI